MALITPGPPHPAIITRATFEAAQAIAAEHATSRDGYDTADGRRTYILRSRIRCASTAGACPAPTPRHPHRRRARHLLLLPHRPGNARHAAHPANVMVREDILLAAIRQFFDEHIFGPERAAILAAPLPRRRRRPGRHRAHDAAKLETRLRQIDAAEGHTQE